MKGEYKNARKQRFPDRKKKVKLFRRKKKADAEDLEITNLTTLCEQFDSSSAQSFEDFPLSKKLKRALKESNFVSPTPIQKEGIGLALKGFDILGAAKTGSGKTLAFLIPILESLYKLKWSSVDGLGALIITPTRELAYQIFEVLKKVGSHHDFSAGLIIGGKDLKFERKRMDRCTIMICTPGRLLQHMDENPLFDCSNLQFLVLDEADRILDLGFQRTMNAIIENLPQNRQTMLYSATQTKSVKDLARLSLKDPVYVSVHEHAKHSTPEGLRQSYMICEIENKMDLLWSFLKHHLKQKILVFMSCCKQVKYTYEAFCRMRPGMSVLALYGSMHQLRRMSVYDDFCHKQHAVLFATDIAARGLDFPSVNWVVQLDCPEDANTYIHRAGRTARYENNGESLLILMPSEQMMLQHLQEKKIPITKIDANPKKLSTIQRKIEAILAKDVSLKDSAKRAFATYIKAMHLMKDKTVFDVTKLNLDAYARSLGLATVPRIRYLEKRLNQMHSKKLKTKPADDNTAKVAAICKPPETDDASEEEEEEDSHQAYSFPLEDSDDELLTVKKKHLPEVEHTSPPLETLPDHQKSKKAVTKIQVAKKLLKKNIKPNVHFVFDEDGAEVVNVHREQVSENAKAVNEDDGGIDIEAAKTVMQEEDKFDKQLYRDRMKTLKKKQKQKAKEALRKEREFRDDSDDEEGVESNAFIASLPDPDAVYGKKQAWSEDSENEGFDEQVSKKTLKRKKADAEKGPAKKKQKKASTDTGLSLVDEEELALHLLSAS